MKTTNNEQVINDMMANSEAASSPSARVYQVAWFSPRGFANEGCYIYGDESAVAECLSKYANDCDSNFEIIENDIMTLSAAKEVAEKNAFKECGMTASHEICSIGVMGTDEFLFG